MKKQIIYFSLFSFLIGLFLSQYEYNWFIFTAGLTISIYYINKNLTQIKSISPSLNLNPRIQFWDHIYFYLLSLNFKSIQNEFRVWAMNIEDIEDFKSFVSLSEQIALKSNLNLKFLSSHSELSILEKLISTDAGKKVRFSQVNPSSLSLPFKNKFDIIYIGNISKLLAANPNFHKRIKNCIHKNSLLILESNVENLFMKNSWTKLAPGIFSSEQINELSNSSNFNLRNDLTSNFI